MDDLQAYLDEEYRRDKSEIEELKRLTAQVTRTFTSFFDSGSGTWPYKVEGVQGSPDTAAREYSFSTNAMISFMIGVTLWGTRGSVLVPALEPHESPELAEDLHKMLQENFAKASTVLFKTLGTRPDPLATSSNQPNPVTTSHTYGRNDPFTLTWLIEILKLSETQVHNPIISKYEQIILHSAREVVARAYEKPEDSPLLLKSDDKLPHTFPLLRCIQLAGALQQRTEAKPVTLEKADQSQVLKHLTTVLHLQLSYFSVPGGEHDAAELVFALEGILRLNPKFDWQVVSRALCVIGEAQKRVPYWRPLKPFIATPQGSVLFPISVEVANSLLRICELLGDRDVFAQHLDLLRSYANWLRSRVIEGYASLGSENRPFLGWYSEHVLAPRTIHLWMTSQVILFLLHYAAMLQKHVARRLIRAARFQSRPPNRSSASQGALEDLLVREPLESELKGSRYKITERIRDHFVLPRTSTSTNGQPGQDRHFSILLFGPPGTGKSTIVERLADAIGYGFVTITPSDFVKGGESQVELQAKAIFTALEEQSGLVVLFDEIDRLLLDRDSSAYQKQGDIFQFMTPGMLTKLNNLRQTRRIIFVIATNYAERIDGALMRPGRIDDHLILLPPDKARRLRIIQDLIKKRTRETVSSADLEDAAKKTSLWIFSELFQLVDEAWRNLQDRGGETFSSRIKAALESVLTNGVIIPTNRLLNYERRMPLESPAEWPVEEFFLMLYLFLESGQHPPDVEREMISKRSPTLRSKLSAVREQRIRDRLDEFLSSPAGSCATGSIPTEG